MSTTSLKLSDELKQRAASAARELGISTHAFMVDAIRQAADSVEQRSQFLAQAQAALTAMQQRGQGYDAGDVHAYLRERLTNRQTAKPVAKPWRE